MKSTLGTSLTEVMVMMVILSIAIVGIYTMVNSGQKLATLTDTRLKAINIAREGLESVATLRDTFALKGFEPGECSATPPVNAFFSINEDVLTGTVPINCPQTTGTYILKDDKTLFSSASTEVCINEFGWYSQEFSAIWPNLLATCRTTPSTPWCVACWSTTALCGNNITQSCKTKFKREITFKSDNASACGAINNPLYCLEVFSKVSWWTASADETLKLNQILTRLN